MMRYETEDFPYNSRGLTYHSFLTYQRLKVSSNMTDNPRAIPLWVSSRNAFVNLTIIRSENNKSK